MSATQLITDLDRLGIRIEAHGDRLRYSPRSAVTPELANRMRARKAELLAILRGSLGIGACSTCRVRLLEVPTFDGFLNLECPSCDRCFGCRPSTEEIAARFRKPKEKAKSVFVNKCPLFGEIVSCPQCEDRELWHSATGDLFGLMDIQWCCSKCDPPLGSHESVDPMEG